MKVLLTIFSFFILASAIAVPFDEIKVGSNAKTSSLEIKYNSTHKKNKKAVVSMVDEKGNSVNSFKIAIKKGSNIIPLVCANELNEGLYTINILVKKKTLSTKLMIFK